MTTTHRLLAAVWNTDPIQQALGGASVAVALTAGVTYQLTAGSKSLRFKQGGAGVVAAATSNFLAAGAVVVIDAIDGFDYVAVIEGSAGVGGQAEFMHPTAGG